MKHEEFIKEYEQDIEDMQLALEDYYKLEGRNKNLRIARSPRVVFKELIKKYFNTRTGHHLYENPKQEKPIADSLGENPLARLEENNSPVEDLTKEVDNLVHKIEMEIGFPDFDESGLEYLKERAKALKEKIIEAHYKGKLLVEETYQSLKKLNEVLE